MRVLFVLPGRGGGGGAHSIVQESLGLQRLGVEVAIANTASTLPAFQLTYPELEQRRVPVHVFETAAELAEIAGRHDIACATTWESVHLLAEALPGKRAVKIGYYVQDYEPLFCVPGSDQWQRARRSYAEIPDATIFAKTDWVCDMVVRNHGRPVARVRASIDHDLYHPGPPRPAGPLTISAMIRPKTLRRAPRRSARILEMLADAHGERLTLMSFGSPRDELAAAGIRLSDRIEQRGELRRGEVAAVLRASDLFLDLSDYQAFGRTGLEAMACGCVPLLPLFGGADEYVRHWANGFLVDTRSDDEIMAVVGAFLDLGDGPRARMRNAAIETALDYTIDKAAFSELTLFRTMLG